ncbi:DUF1707 domain-containing protein [Streptomyces sp. NPDC086783]|uniref:DUF1707 SHOCT-like domain-containing protein n=1 Tax=Streptomyces sp. NPDC086783 TaxID=3365758 RepID=UPI003817C725
MSGETSPTGKPAGPASSPELRASHADRDRVVDVLRIAAGDGLLNSDELDERLEVALSARTVTELASLTADLPPISSDGGLGRGRGQGRWSGSSRCTAGRSNARDAGSCRGGWSSL